MQKKEKVLLELCCRHFPFIVTYDDKLVNSTFMLFQRQYCIKIANLVTDSNNCSNHIHYKNCVETEFIN